jgi:hypothetical protein
LGKDAPAIAAWLGEAWSWMIKAAMLVLREALID